MIARGRGALPARPPLVRPQGRGARPRPAPARRPVRAGRQRPPRRVERGGRDGRRLAARLRPASRRHLPHAVSTAAHVDAEPRPGKVGGAYCSSISKTVLPYVLMNYTDQLRDVITLAHEFGHAVHGTLSLERQTYRSYHTGLALAEVPSTFAQLLAVERLIELEEDPVDARDAPRRPGRERDGVDLPPDDDGALRACGRTPRAARGRR